MSIESRQRRICRVRLFLAASVLAASANVSAQTNVTVLPANAVASHFGSRWECSRGFQKVEQACVAIKVPANAYLNYSGSGWDCDRSYLKFNQGCKAVQVPANAHEEDQHFGSGWQCNRGYRM